MPHRRVIAQATPVRRGEFVAIVEPSGCGKSTLLNMVAGTLRPSAGSVRYDGQIVAGPNSDVGYITQKNYCVPWRTVEGNADAGVGFRIREATSFFNTAAVFARLVVLMAISMVLLGALKLIERRVLRWQTADNVIEAEAGV